MGTVQQRRVVAGILLATLAASALFLAKGTTLLLADALFRGLKGEAAELNLGGGRVATSSRKTDSRIRARNIFDSSNNPFEVIRELLAPDGDPSDATLPGEFDPDNVPPCSGTVSLVGAMAVPSSPEWSVAALKEGSNKAMLYNPGMEVGGLRLMVVDTNRVLMLPTNGQYCQLGMFTDAPGAAPPPPTPMAPNAAARARSAIRNQGAITQEMMDASITRVSDTNFTIDRSLVNQIIENQAALMRTARIVPHEENGQVVGVKMYGIRRRALLGRLGLMNGDTLRTINGFDMGSPDSALEAYSRLREADNLTLSIIRRGQPVTVEYNIQ